MNADAPTMSHLIAALYVQPRGCYSGLPGVDPWDAARDARLYVGPHPVVAHPPCARWGRYASGGPSHHGKFTPGDDGGCFQNAYLAVRIYGGVLEHPMDSKAFAHFGIAAPPREGMWVPAGDGRGWVCCVEQGHYGHAARKPTWLYAVTIAEPQALRWGPSVVDRRPGDSPARGMLERLSKNQRAATPIPFRDVLIDIARQSRRIP